MAKEVKTWWLDRAREPSTYQGLSILAGALGGWLLGDPETGIRALQAGLGRGGVDRRGKSRSGGRPRLLKRPGRKR